MTVVPVLESIGTKLAHRVRLVHSATGQRIPVTSPLLLTSPFGWRVRVAGDEVLVIVPIDQEPLVSPPRLQVIVADGLLADLLTFPTPEPDQPPDSVRLPLTSPEIDVPLSPLAMTLTVVLTAGGTGAPSAGRTVTLRPAPAIPLPETAEPGTYRSAPLVWDQQHTPGDLRVGTTSVRKVGVDVRRTDTRVHVVDPT